MRARHVTSEREFRNPIGAVHMGGAVTLSLDVWDAEVVFATLRVWTEEDGCSLIEMHTGEGAPGGALRFSAEYRPAHTGVVWYSFDIEAADGSVWRYGARPGWTTGEGDFAYGDPPSFQITVYEPRKERPTWYERGIVYQVFPDRFARGMGWREQAEQALARPCAGVGRALVEDWEEPPTYTRNDDGSIKCWDFYGGTLRGVRERLDYLEDLGVTCIYLNPIFEATSNHRYDAGDYLHIDPMLGTEYDLRALCVDAAERGISVILDGVFNHCGADSKYFNRFGNYPEPGAWQNEDSPYRSWFSFNEDGTYDGWWGNPDLPELQEAAEDYRQLICGRNGVVRHWLRAGVRGWRLDVADELSDEFIAEIRRAMLDEKPDGVLIGEVWEDASHKVAYGKMRHYFQGEELDATMNYPLRTAILGFLRGTISAPEVAARLRQLSENYPREALYSALNLLGSHDRERLFTMLGGAPDPDTMTDEACVAYKLTDDQAALATSRLWVAALLQMTLPGVPCVYYGDELGLEGFRDPYNRSTMPWDSPRERMDCTSVYRNAIALRRTLPVLIDGDFEPFAAAEDVLGFWRRDAEGNAVCVLANASLSKSHTVSLPMVGESVTDVVTGATPVVKGGRTEVFLWPLGTAVVSFRPRQRLQKPLRQGMGVLCHITSVPNDGRPGTLGAPARRFVKCLADCGQRYWQVLPINPTDAFGSPYAGVGAFAGNLALLGQSPEATLAQLGDLSTDAHYKEFCRKNDFWLAPWCAFRAIKSLVGDNVPWQEWDAEFASFSPALLRDPRLAEAAERERHLQYAFECEWQDLREYARELGVSIIGDMPMYVSADSADVWSEPDVFDLTEKGYARNQAGAPGDAFAPEGQLWGNPTYRWDVLAERGYDWWLRRLNRALSLYDWVRLDHFVGFSSYWKIPAGKQAAEGAYAFGPGTALFEAAQAQFGALPIIAEDLGAITPAVRALLDATGLPGMDIAQFSDADVREGFTSRPGAVAYTGTHDNQTLVGFCEERYEQPRDEALRTAKKITSNVLASEAPVVIVPLQDVLQLGDEARMNVPGVAEGNWSWQATQAQVDEATPYLLKLAEEFLIARDKG